MKAVLSRLAGLCKRFCAFLDDLLFPDRVRCLCCSRALDETEEDGLCPDCAQALAEQERTTLCTQQNLASVLEGGTEIGGTRG